MASKQVAQSYEVAEYSKPELDTAQAYGVVKQIFFEIQRTQAQYSIWADWSGDKVKIHYHSYEMFLPERISEIQERSRVLLDETVKMLKKEFKARTGHTLKLVEDKTLSDYTMEKVSLNQRYYYKAWRFYTVSF